MAGELVLDTPKQTIAVALKRASARLEGAGVGTPRLDSELLLAAALGADRKALFVDPGRAVDAAARASFESFIERRLAREPVAYILGHREFWSLDLRVDREVLIPRPETERLIEVLLQEIRARKLPSDGGNLLDIGTGSGNIAIAAAKEFSRLQIVAVDVSAAALAVAGDNAHRHGLNGRIRFVRGDVFSPGWVDSGPFQWIASNPPYIPSNTVERLMPEVARYEPRLALDGGPDGLEYYRRIVPEAWPRLSPGGGLLLETGDDQGAAVMEMIRSHGGFLPPELFYDHSGRVRVVLARKPDHG